MLVAVVAVVALWTLGDAEGVKWVAGVYLGANALAKVVKSNGRDEAI